MRVAGGLFAAVSLAIVITALTMKDRQTPAVIDSTSNGAVRLVEAGLGENPTVSKLY